MQIEQLVPKEDAAREGSPLSSLLAATLIYPLCWGNPTPRFRNGIGDSVIALRPDVNRMTAGQVNSTQGEPETTSKHCKLKKPLMKKAGRTAAELTAN